MPREALPIIFSLQIEHGEIFNKTLINILNNKWDDLEFNVNGKNNLVCWKKGYPRRKDEYFTKLEISQIRQYAEGVKDTLIACQVTE